MANAPSLSVPIRAYAPAGFSHSTTVVEAPSLSLPIRADAPAGSSLSTTGAEAPSLSLPNRADALAGSSHSTTVAEAPSLSLPISHDDPAGSFHSTTSIRDHVALAVSGDSVRRVYPISKPEPELSLQCTIGSGPAPTSVRAVLDTGAGFNYWCGSPHCLELRDCPEFTVQLADDSSSVVRKKATCLVTLHMVDGKPAHSHMIDLYVIDTPSLEPVVLLGRAAVREYGLHTAPGRVYLANGCTLVDHNRNRDSVRIISDVGSHDVESVLDWVIDRGWQRLQRAAAGYQFRLRVLQRDEPKDTVEQTHTFEIRVPRPTTTVQELEPDKLRSVIRQVEGAARGHLARQSRVNQQCATKLVQEYMSKGFWQSSSEEECRRLCAHLPTPVFMIDGGDSGRKARLVCNFIPVNAELPPCVVTRCPVLTWLQGLYRCHHLIVSCSACIL